VTTIGDSSINKCFISSSIVCWQVNNQLDYLNVDNIPKSIQYKTSDRNTDFTYFFLKYDGKLEYNETDIGTVVPTNTPSTYPGEIEARNIFYQDKIYYKRTGNIYS
jgi:hypothetical protein